MRAVRVVGLAVALAVGAALQAAAQSASIVARVTDPDRGVVVDASLAGRALAAGTSLHRVLELVTELRRDVDVPIVLFGYYNPFFRYGHAALARDAAAAGADGFLCVDLPPEEGGDFQAAVRAAGLDLIFLLAPTSGPGRIRSVARTASGFVYFVSVLGVTGARAELPSDLPEQRVEAGASGERGLLELLVELGLVASRGEARRLVAQRAVAIDERIVEDAALRLGTGTHQIRVGKRRFARVEIA